MENIKVDDNNLQLILNKYNTKKNSKYNNYGKYYEKYLNNYINKQIRYLEIGVSRGESLFAMHEYFNNAKYIVGIDMNPYSIIFEQKQNNIFVEIGKQNNELFLKKVNDKYGSFDVIIDDGSHE
jgi:tRNA G46 methylase TrmB